MWLGCFPEDHQRDSKVSSEICGFVSQSTRLYALRQGSDIAAQCHGDDAKLGQHGPQQQVRFAGQAKNPDFIFILFYLANTFSPFGCLVAVEAEWMRGEGVVVQTLAELPFPTAHSCMHRSYVAQETCFIIKCGDFGSTFIKQTRPPLGSREE